MFCPYKYKTRILIANSQIIQRRHDREVDDCRWFAIDEAPKIMTYKSEREMVEKAAKMLN